jgi:hypothetical protein
MAVLDQRSAHAMGIDPTMGDGLAKLLRDRLADTPNVTIFGFVDECLDFALAHGYPVPLIWKNRLDGVCVGIRDPRCRYDPREFRWYRQSSTDKVHHVFHLIDSAGGVHELDFDSGSFREAFRICSHHAYCEFLETILGESPARCHQSKATVQDFFDIYMPFFRDPSELHVSERADGAFPSVSSYVDFRYVSQLVKQHAAANAEWLHPALVEVNRKTRSRAINQIRNGSRGSIGSYVEALLAPKRNAPLFKNCVELSSRLPGSAYLSLDSHSQYILIRPGGMTPFGPPFGIPESRWFEDACILRVRPPHSASFMALFLRSREGATLKLHIRLRLVKGHRSAVSRCYSVPPRDEQLRAWIQFSHDGEFLASAYRRLAEGALSPFSCVADANQWRTFHSLREGRSLLRGGILGLPVDAI